MFGQRVHEEHLQWEAYLHMCRPPATKEKRVECEHALEGNSRWETWRMLEANSSMSRGQKEQYCDTFYDGQEDLHAWKWCPNVRRQAE